jgi:hypothetical protein
MLSFNNNFFSYQFSNVSPENFKLFLKSNGKPNYYGCLNVEKYPIIEELANCFSSIVPIHYMFKDLIKDDKNLFINSPISNLSSSIVEEDYNSFIGLFNDFIHNILSNQNNEILLRSFISLFGEIKKNMFIPYRYSIYTGILPGFSLYCRDLTKNTGINSIPLFGYVKKDIKIYTTTDGSLGPIFHYDKGTKLPLSWKAPGSVLEYITESVTGLISKINVGNSVLCGNQVLSNYATPPSYVKVVNVEEEYKLTGFNYFNPNLEIGEIVEDNISTTNISLRHVFGFSSDLNKYEQKFINSTGNDINYIPSSDTTRIPIPSKDSMTIYLCEIRLFQLIKKDKITYIYNNERLNENTIYYEVIHFELIDSYVINPFNLYNGIDKNKILQNINELINKAVKYVSFTYDNITDKMISKIENIDLESIKLKVYPLGQNNICLIDLRKIIATSSSMEMVKVYKGEGDIYGKDVKSICSLSAFTITKNIYIFSTPYLINSINTIINSFELIINEFIKIINENKQLTLLFRSFNLLGVLTPSIMMNFPICTPCVEYCENIFYQEPKFEIEKLTTLTGTINLFKNDLSSGTNSLNFIPSFSKFIKSHVFSEKFYITINLLTDFDTCSKSLFFMNEDIKINSYNNISDFLLSSATIYLTNDKEISNDLQTKSSLIGKVNFPLIIIKKDEILINQTNDISNELIICCTKNVNYASIDKTMENNSYLVIKISGSQIYVSKPIWTSYNFEEKAKDGFDSLILN